MRKIIFSLCVLLASLSVFAAPISGIRVESSEPMVVFIDGQQICTPTLSCFIANLRGGNYRIEAYSAHRGDHSQRGNLLYDERVFYAGTGIKEILVGRRHDNGNRPDILPYREPVMDRKTFEDFFNQYKNEPFDSGRQKLLNTVLVTSGFTADQCRRLMELFNFDSEKKTFFKKIYPAIVDKQNVFGLMEEFDFRSSKDEMNDFIKKYHEQK